MFRHLVLWVLLALGTAGVGAAGFGAAGLTPVQAAESDADKAAIVEVIQQQYDAFARDDDEAAFALATPNVRRMYGAAEVFMQGVRQAYAPVYRHRSAQFGELRDGTNLIVALVGPDGRHWLAMYVMAKDPDGQWRINGCHLIEDPDTHV